MKMIKKEAWVTEKDYRKFASKQSPANYLGYTIVEKSEALGEIMEVIEQPHQLLCRLEINDKTFIRNETFIDKFDDIPQRIEFLTRKGRPM